MDIILDIKDLLHYNKVSKKEKKDGKPRPFEKYVLTPSFFIYLKVIIILIALGGSYFGYQHFIGKPKATEKEISKISEYLKEYHLKFNHFPNTIDDLIGNSPNRKSWHTDAWGNVYSYKFNNHANTFMIVSVGKDGNFDTEDDIKITD